MHLISKKGGSRAGPKQAAYHSQSDTALSCSKDLLRGGRKGRTTLFFMEVNNLQNGGKKLGPEYNQKLHTDVTLATNLHFRRQIAIGLKEVERSVKSQNH